MPTNIVKSCLRLGGREYLKVFILCCCVLILCVTINVSTAQASSTPNQDAKDGNQDKMPLDIESIGARRIIFAPMNVSVFDRGRLAARANIELVLEVKDLADVANIRQRKPQLRADFLAAVNQLARQHFRMDQPIDPNLVKKFAMAYVDRRLGPGKVEIYVLQAYIESL